MIKEISVTERLYTLLNKSYPGEFSLTLGGGFNVIRTHPSTGRYEPSYAPEHYASDAEFIVEALGGLGSLSVSYTAPTCKWSVNDSTGRPMYHYDSLSKALCWAVVLTHLESI